MARNDFERLCRLYLRLNGFFHVTDFTVHFTDKNPEEIDFIGVRFPNSIEKAIRSNGSFDEDHVFADDPYILEWIDNSKLTIVLGEATMSPYGDKIAERIEKLDSPLRIKYALQRFGITSENEIKKILSNNSKIKLLRVLFLISDKLIPNQKSAVEFLTYQHISSFIQDRANDALKIKGIALLPQGLQDVVTFLRSLDLDRSLR